MDNPIVNFQEITDGRFTVICRDGKFFIEDEVGEFPKFFVESGTAKRIFNYLSNKEKEIKNLNFEVNRLENKIASLIDRYNERYIKNNYLVNLIEKDTNDERIIKEISDKLPCTNDIKVNSNDMFLTIEQIEDGNSIIFTESNICKILEIPEESLSFKTHKKYKNYNTIIYYFKWNDIIDSFKNEYLYEV